MAEPPRPRTGILLITRNLPPLRGGMERLVQHIAETLAETNDLTVVGPAGCAAFLPQHVQAHECESKPLLHFLLAAANAVRKTSKKDFEVVIAGSGLTAPLAWWAARRSRTRFAVYLHGLDIIAPSKIYQQCWLPFIRRADLVLVNSRNTRRLAIERGVPQHAIEILHPGTELPPNDPYAGPAFRATHDLGARPLLLSIGRLTPRKGLAEFITHALPTILSRDPDTLLVVIGADANDAVRPAKCSEYSRILKHAEEANLTAAVRLLPPCDDATLSAAYRAADAHVFPVLDFPGDVEGFGMVAIEAAAHGLPTIAFEVGGVADALIEGITGNLVEAGDYAGFAALVHQWLAKRQQLPVRDQCSGAAAVFGWVRFGTQLKLALRELRRIER